jgi:hypothetical protein
VSRWHDYYLGTFQKCKFLSPSPDLLIEILVMVVVVVVGNIRVWRSPQTIFITRESLRTSGLE